MDNRLCEQCRKDYRRPAYATPEEFRRRRFCSLRCSSKWQMAQKYGAVMRRVRHVLSYEPNIQPWQLAERFGVDEETAKNWRSKYRRRCVS